MTDLQPGDATRTRRCAVPGWLPRGSRSCCGDSADPSNPREVLLDRKEYVQL